MGRLCARAGCQAKPCLAAARCATHATRASGCRCAWTPGAWAFLLKAKQVTPNYLSQIETSRCPVTRQALHGLPGQADTSVLARLNPQAAYAAGNLASLSAAAHAGWQGLEVQDCVRQAHVATAQAAAASDTSEKPAATPFTAAVWWRLAALRSYATPLPFAQAACLPMAVLPPNRVRLLNAVQGLQALLTYAFATPGWAERCRRFAQWLPAHTLRQDFNLFVGAMAPRVLEAGHDPAALRLALEDAWLNERVLRRWTHLVLSLGEAATEALLQRATETGLAGVRAVQHAPAQAVEGWALPAAASKSTATTADDTCRTPLRVAARLLPARTAAAQAAQAAQTAQARLC